MAGFSSDFDKWARKPETIAKLASEKKCVWSQFSKQFPNADKTQFNVETSIDEKYNISAEVLFNEGPGSSQSLFGSDRKYWSQRMKTAIGLIGVAGFPFKLSPLKTTKKNIANSCSRFHRSCAQPCQNLQRREKNLCDARRIFRRKISQHFSTNQAQAHGIC